MTIILAEILSLFQYIKILIHAPEQYRPNRCPGCGKSGLWRHGHYSRKADRLHQPDKSLNPIFIQRFFCPNCKHTCSLLPECIAPHRWYLWAVQQAALLLILTGKSFSAVAKEIPPSRHTISRWMSRFKERFHLHKDTLCHHFIALGRHCSFSDFWPTCLNIISLSQAMRLCHVAGVPIP